ncbi:MAG: hypothetical protein IJ563_07460 [Selenomonadaceae bacterium]|nr:hypothetical protein [Selenomonadaceae bacterium]MBR1860165.1 hypothetical protein [Selenomonadaceae bacterium]
MARIQKRIKKNIMRPKEQEAKSTKPKPKENVGKDYMLVGVIIFTTVVMLIGWSTFTNMNRAMYVCLIASLSLTYVKRHYNLSEIQEVWVDRTSLMAMGFAVALFALVMYNQIFA